MVISVTDALPGLSGLLWEGWVGVWYMCGMRNGWPQVALCGSLEPRSSEVSPCIDRLLAAGSDLLIYRTSVFQILLYSVQYSFWQAAEGSASSSSRIQVTTEFFLG